MKIFLIKQKQFLPISLQEAWWFFSNPINLGEITPDKMDFKITYISGDGKMYPGQLIRYRIKIFAGIWVNWVTEITHMTDQQSFIDEQRFGPYAFWHHQHYFRSVDGGVEMVDEVNYALPFGIIGRFVHWLFVGPEVRAIFAHRYRFLYKKFPQSASQMSVSS